MAEAPPIEYLAGILDACALFRVRDAGGTQLPAIYLHGLPVPVLEIFAKYTGTKVVTVTRDYHRTPCSAHCTEAHSHVQSITGRWSVTGAKATVLLASVVPYLRVQRAQALEVLALGVNAPRKGNSYAKMEALGWPSPDAAPGLRLVQ